MNSWQLLLNNPNILTVIFYKMRLNKTFKNRAEKSVILYCKRRDYIAGKYERLHLDKSPEGNSS